jgi:hypothetical protein
VPLDSQEYTTARREDFQERLKRSRENHSLSNKIEVTWNSLHQKGEVTKFSGSSTIAKASPNKQINENQWLDIMDAFATRLASIQAKSPPGYSGDFLKDDTIKMILKKDVTIALIDDGVDFVNPLISESLKPGKCFPHGLSEDYDVVGAPDPPFHESTTGHGTNMAYQIRRICPAAKIIPCKVHMLRHEPPSKANFTAKSAADVSTYFHFFHNDMCEF